MHRLTILNIEFGNTKFFLHIFANKKCNMAEIKKQRGGKRAGAGRPKGASTHAMPLKLDIDLYEVLISLKSKDFNRNRYINDAVRSAMVKDGYIK